MHGLRVVEVWTGTFNEQSNVCAEAWARFVYRRLGARTTTANFHGANIGTTYQKISTGWNLISGTRLKNEKSTHLAQFFDFVAGFSDHASGLALVDHHTQIQFISVHSASVLEKIRREINFYTGWGGILRFGKKISTAPGGVRRKGFTHLEKRQ